MEKMSVTSCQNEGVDQNHSNHKNLEDPRS